MKKLPNDNYMANLSQARLVGHPDSRSGTVSQQEHHDRSQSPPHKRPNRTGDFRIPTQKKAPPRPTCQQTSTLPGVILPPDFQADSGFQWTGPSMSKDPVDQGSSEKGRSQRRRNKTQIYQSEVEDCREKSMRQGQH